MFKKNPFPNNLKKEIKSLIKLSNKKIKIKNFEKEIDWSFISKQKLSEDFIEFFIDKINFQLLYDSNNLPQQIIDKHINKIALSFNEKTLFKFKDLINLVNLSKKMMFSEKFLEQLLYKIKMSDFNKILMYQTVSDEFIKKYSNFIFVDTFKKIVQNESAFDKDVKINIIKNTFNQIGRKMRMPYINKNLEFSQYRDLDRCIIIGSGTSVREGIEKDLINKIKDEITIGVNFVYNTIKTDILAFLDGSVLEKMSVPIDSETLIVTQNQNKTYLTKRFNLFFLRLSNKLNLTKPFEYGIYGGNLSGIFALSLAIALGFKEIFLLGMDFGNKTNKNDIYFYDNPQNSNGTIVKNGKHIYKTNHYNNSSSDYYGEFKDIDVKIWNVSKISKIEEFPKISYDEFFKKIKVNKPNIIENKKEIKSILKNFN